MIVPVLLAASLLAAPAKPKPPANPRAEGPAFAVSSCAGCVRPSASVAGIAPGTFTVQWTDPTVSPIKGVFRTFDLKRHGGPERRIGDSQSQGLGVAALARGFVLGWREQPRNLFVRTLDPAGNPSGDPIHVNPGHPTNVDEDTPSLAATLDGRFLVVWDRVQEQTNTRGPSSIMARRGDLSGALGPEVTLGTSAANAAPIACSHPSGSSVVAWTRRNQVPTEADPEVPLGISLHRLAADGSPEGGLVEVLAPEEEGRTLGIALACAPDGGFVLAWQTARSPAESGTDVVLQRFNAAGERIGGPFRVNALTAVNQTSPALLYESGGRLLIAWASATGAKPEIRGRRMSADGQLVGKELVLIKSKAGAEVQAPALAQVGERGRFVVVWKEGGVYSARIFRP